MPKRQQAHSNQSPKISGSSLLWVTFFLILFIPLYPKIPLIEVIPNYIVRVRLEDFFLSLGVGVLGIYLWKNKISLKTPLNRYILFYVLAGVASLISAFLIINTLPRELPHIGKAFLHLLRYIEYFALFFLSFVAVRDKKSALTLISGFFLTLILVTLYGIGQQNFKWPVFSTMSWEYSSGIPLELASEAARVQSTFAGHYDFGIYTALILPLVVSMLLKEKKRSLKVLFLVIFILGLWSLIASGLRMAFLAYICALTVVIGLAALRQKKWSERFRWAGMRLVFFYMITGGMFLVFGHNLRQLLEASFKGAVATQERSTTELIVDQYQVPVPKDVTKRNPAPVKKEEMILSECARKKELSLCIRLESLWPKALHGFYLNPVLGSGYSSLNKRDFAHLAEADGTDSNYLRILGETGILGFITFFSVITAAVLSVWKAMFAKDEFKAFLAIGYIGVVVAILANALLFDVFAASKVAFTFWAITGVVVGFVLREERSEKKTS